MIVVSVDDVCFQDYQLPAMLVHTAICDFKCNREAGKEICQNYDARNGQIYYLEPEDICQRYNASERAKAIIFGGFEPLLQHDSLVAFISLFRKEHMDDVVIYTGYYPDEVEAKIKELAEYPNIIIKFGRYIPEMERRYDDVLGVTLASANQFGMRIS